MNELRHSVLKQADETGRAAGFRIIPTVISVPAQSAPAVTDTGTSSQISTSAPSTGSSDSTATTPGTGSGGSTGTSSSTSTSSATGTPSTTVADPCPDDDPVTTGTTPSSSGSGNSSSSGTSSTGTTGAGGTTPTDSAGSNSSSGGGTSSSTSTTGTDGSTTTSSTGSNTGGSSTSSSGTDTSGTGTQPGSSSTPSTSSSGTDTSGNTGAGDSQGSNGTSSTPGGSNATGGSDTTSTGSSQPSTGSTPPVITWSGGNSGQVDVIDASDGNGNPTGNALYLHGRTQAANGDIHDVLVKEDPGAGQYSVVYDFGKSQSQSALDPRFEYYAAGTPAATGTTPPAVTWTGGNTGQVAVVDVSDGNGQVSSDPVYLMGRTEDTAGKMHEVLVEQDPGASHYQVLADFGQAQSQTALDPKYEFQATTAPATSLPPAASPTPVTPSPMDLPPGILLWHDPASGSTTGTGNSNTGSGNTGTTPPLLPPGIDLWTGGNTGSGSNTGSTPPSNLPPGGDMQGSGSQSGNIPVSPVQFMNLWAITNALLNFVMSGQSLAGSNEFAQNGNGLYPTLPGAASPTTSLPHHHHDSH